MIGLIFEFIFSCIAVYFIVLGGVFAVMFVLAGMEVVAQVIAAPFMWIHSKLTGK